jgi:hypothetical protein
MRVCVCVSMLLLLFSRLKKKEKKKGNWCSTTCQVFWSLITFKIESIPHLFPGVIWWNGSTRDPSRSLSYCTSRIELFLQSSRINNQNNKKYSFQIYPNLADVLSTFTGQWNQSRCATKAVLSFTDKQNKKKRSLTIIQKKKRWNISSFGRRRRPPPQQQSRGKGLIWLFS